MKLKGNNTASLKIGPQAQECQGYHQQTFQQEASSKRPLGSSATDIAAVVPKQPNLDRNSPEGPPVYSPGTHNSASILGGDPPVRVQRSSSSSIALTWTLCMTCLMESAFSPPQPSMKLP
ncbi:TPA: hypothetical protein ACH3X1_005778 [Trebouxia sp. C0004]